MNNLLAIEMEKTQLIVSKPVYLGLMVLKINEMVMYEFWHKLVKQKYGEKAK